MKRIDERAAPASWRLLAGSLRRRCAAEDGQAMLLGIGMIAVVLALILGIASVTSVYLDVKRLTAMADSAAAAGAGNAAPGGYYAGGGGAAAPSGAEESEGAATRPSGATACEDCSATGSEAPGGLPAAPIALDDSSVRSAAVDDVSSQAQAGVAGAGGLSGVSVSDAHAEGGSVAVVTLSAHSRPPFLPWGLLPFEGFDISATGSARTTTGH